MSKSDKKLRRCSRRLKNTYKYKNHFENRDGLKYMFDIKHKLLLHLRQEEILPSHKIKNMFKKVNVLKPLVSHPIVNEVYEILESFPKRKKCSMNNHSKRNNRSENSNVASLEIDSETQPIDGNISNYKSDVPFQNDKMEPHGKITTSMSSQVNKLVTDLQASEGFPMELLSNQNFNIECQESQYECVENPHYDKTSDTLTLDAVVKRLTPIVFSQPIVENMENSAINPVESTQESEFNYNNEPSSSETHQAHYRSSQPETMNTNFEAGNTNNESFVFVINESGKHFNQIIRTDTFPELYSSQPFGEKEVNEITNTQDENDLITIANAFIESVDMKETESLQTNVHQCESEIMSGFSRNNINKNIILQQEINSVMIFAPSSLNNNKPLYTEESNDSFTTSQERIIEKITKEKTKWIPKWNSLSVSEKVSCKFADKFCVRIFNEPVNSLLNVDKLAQPSNNTFFRSFTQEDLEKWTPEIDSSVQNLSETLKKLELLDTRSNPSSVDLDSDADSSDTDEDSETNYKKWLRNYRKTTKLVDVKAKYMKFLDQEFTEHSVPEEEDFQLKCEQMVNSKFIESFKNTLVWFKE